MFSSNLRFVPWRDKEEWLTVYEDAYSSDPNRQHKACQAMEIWLLLRNDVPPGVECTVNLLYALHNDQVLQADLRQLELMYSTAILRVINMLCDNARQSGKETIFTIAKYYNIPDWIVNLRHDVAHGKTLPDISMLRKSAKFLLAWLREYYWEMENEEMKDIIVKRSREEACRVNVNYYLETYIQLMDLSKKAIERIKSIPQEDLRFKVFDVNKHRAFECAIECLPWIRHARDNYAKEIPQKDIANMKIPVFLKLMLLQASDYLAKDFWQFNSTSLLIEALSKHFISNKCIKKEIWEPLIQSMNSWGALDRLMSGLCESISSSDSANDSSTAAAKAWLRQLSRSVVKRHRAEMLCQHLSSVSLLSSDSTEQAVARKMMLRKRLSLTADSPDSTVYSILYKKVEKKYPDLSEAFRLQSTVDYIVSSCSCMKMIETLVGRPNRETLSFLNDFYELLKPDFPKSKREDLNSLILILLGEKSITKKCNIPRNVKTIGDLSDDPAKQEDMDHSQILPTPDEMTNLNERAKRDKTCLFVRSNWDFRSCPLGVTPWQLEGVDYYHKPFDKETCRRNYIFPISSHMM